MSRRTLGYLLLLSMCSGCNMVPYSLRPANWWKMNGQDPAPNESMYFSVPDPVTNDPFLSERGSSPGVQDEFTTFRDLGTALR